MLTKCFEKFLALSENGAQCTVEILNSMFEEVIIVTWAKDAWIDLARAGIHSY